ncbi:hypothetical protein PC114_g8685 [Phytophthora cactorum]|nr:hypothetical protein PC114_g8685 [Phytophthora cactorum]
MLRPQYWGGGYSKTFKCTQAQSYKVNVRVATTANSTWELKVSPSDYHNHLVTERDLTRRAFCSIFESALARPQFS